MSEGLLTASQLEVASIKEETRMTEEQKNLEGLEAPLIDSTQTTTISSSNDNFQEPSCEVSAALFIEKSLESSHKPTFTALSDVVATTYERQVACEQEGTFKEQQAAEVLAGTDSKALVDISPASPEGKTFLSLTKQQPPQSFLPHQLPFFSQQKHLSSLSLPSSYSDLKSLHLIQQLNDNNYLTTPSNFKQEERVGNSLTDNTTNNHTDNNIDNATDNNTENNTDSNTDMNTDNTDNTDNDISQNNVLTSLEPAKTRQLYTFFPYQQHQLQQPQQQHQHQQHHQQHQHQNSLNHFTNYLTNQISTQQQQQQQQQHQQQHINSNNTSFSSKFVPLTLLDTQNNENNNNNTSATFHNNKLNTNNNSFFYMPKYQPEQHAFKSITLHPTHLDDLASKGE